MAIFVLILDTIMSSATVEERNIDLSQQRVKLADPPFWKRYMEKEGHTKETLAKEEIKDERMDSSLERISSLEMESTSLLDWTFEEQFKQVIQKLHFLVCYFNTN